MIGADHMARPRGKDKRKKNQRHASHAAPQPQNAGPVEAGAGRALRRAAGAGRPADSAARGWPHNRDSTFRGPGTVGGGGGDKQGVIVLIGT